MRDTHEKLSRAEAAAVKAIQAALAGLDAAQAERVLAHVQDQLDEEAGGPMFARGFAGPLGKLDIPLRTKVDEATAGLFLRHCGSRPRTRPWCCATACTPWSTARPIGRWWLKK